MPGGAHSQASVDRQVSKEDDRQISKEEAIGHERVLTSPAIRRRAQEAGIDLTQIKGSGPRGRILRQDLDETLQAAGSAPQSKPADTVAITAKASPATPALATEEVKVIGLRRIIANRMSEANRTIPHFAYVEEVDVTELEALRRYLNEKHLGRQGKDASPGATALTFLPFILLALAEVLEKYPQCNSWYDAARETLVRHRAVHVGVATQTADGLKVPVVRDVAGRSLWEVAAEIRRVSGLARGNKAKPADLFGSTITVTSLGKLGGVVSTPIINAPEVAIVGVNKAIERPMVVQGQVAIRLMMNLSSSFDHRFVDGHDAASMIQALKERLEHPATIFMQAG